MSNSSIQDYQFIDKNVAAKLTGLSGDTLKRYRQKGKLQKDIHWVSVNSRVVRYNKTLLSDWIQNHQSNPKAHSKAIENYLASLPSSQKKTQGKRS